MKKTILFAGAAATALTMMPASIAIAQNSSATTDVITVTARKREESIQEIPLSVTAFTGDQLLAESVSNFEELALRTPGLQFSQEFGRNGDRPVIRGQASILGASGVAYFVDGVYADAGTIQSFNLADIERIEIIKGPQSALYGRNTYSGAISITTKSPRGEAGGSGFFEYGSDEQIEISLGGSFPINERLGVGFQLRHYERGGTFINTYNGDDIGDEKSDSISLTAEWAPNDNFTARVRAAFQNDDDGPAPNFHQDASENNCYTDNGSFYGGGGRYYCGIVEPGEVAQDYDRQFTSRPGVTLDQDTYSARLDWDIGELTFTSVTGYVYTEDSFSADADYTDQSFEQSVFADFPLFEVFPGGWGWGIANGGVVDFSFEEESKTREWSQEFRFGNDPNAQWHWELGAFYYNAQSTAQQVRDVTPEMQALADANATETFDEICANAFLFCVFPVPLASTNIVYSADTAREEITNTALFGFLEFAATDRLTVSLEARYAEDEISANLRDAALTVNNVVPPAITEIPERTATFDSFNPRFTARYVLNENQMVFLNIAQGNKPGGYNVGVFDDTQQQFDLYGFYDEETVVQYEIGSKNTLADGDLILNGSLYFSEVEDYQLTSSVPNSAGTGTISVSTNVGDAEILGLELETVATPSVMPGWTFMGNYSYTDAEFTSGRDQNQGLLLDTLDNGLVDCSTGNEFPELGDCTSLYGDISGKRIPRVPEHMFFGQVEYRTPVSDNGWEAYGRVNVSHESSRFAQVHNEASTGAATVWGLGAGIENDRHAIRFIGENVGDEDAVLAVIRYADGNASFRRSFFGTLRRGSYYGLSLSTRF